MSSREPVLVVGGAGYIGSHCAKVLAAEGYEPIVFDNLSTGWKDLARFGPLETGDIRNRQDLDRVFTKHRPKAVLHFAALIVVPHSVERPLDYYDNNVAGSLSLIRACRDHGVESFVFSSTAAVYGAPERSPIPLSAPVAPVNPYGVTKATVERILADVAASPGPKPFAATCFRYFNAAGADPDGGIGERHEPETHLIPNALAAAARGTEMHMFGGDYPTPDGTCIRDYIHVVDLVRAHVAALRRPPNPGEVRRFNLGIGRGMSVREILDACERVTERKIDVRIRPRRAGDPPELIAGDTGVARRELDWTPIYTGAEDIVRHAWQWQQELERSRDAHKGA
jgi:UDP-glucose-4-epimerase GalE